MLSASSAEKKERAAVAQRSVFDQLTATIEEDAYRLTEQARDYIITGNRSHLVAYQREKAGLQAVERRVARLRDAGARENELQALRQALHWADLLVHEQAAAIRSAEQGRSDTARAIIFGDEYGRELDRIASEIGKFQYMLDQRTELAVREATSSALRWRTLSEVMLGVTALLFLCVLYFILKQRILRPVVRLSDVVIRLAAQDFDAIPPAFAQVDEIGDMAQAIRIFRENGLERQRLEQERDDDRLLRDRVSRMTQRLQGCEDVAELVDVVRHFVPEITSGSPGKLYIRRGSDENMQQMCDWLSPAQSHEEFAPSACWALRRGQAHSRTDETIDVPCAHVDQGQALPTICIPLTAQGESIGLLYFERPGTGPDDQPERTRQYLEMLAENISLALANLRLRDELREMAMADPLTGLANRRHFDAVLKHQLAASERNGAPLACLMIDIDHFKRFNDSYGHDAGDVVLRAVGGTLQASLREKQFAFRMGGEEFLMLMPGFTLEQAFARAQQVQQNVQSLRVQHNGQELGPITASFGLAIYPDHGPADTLVRAADAALLRAKANGRDQIVVAAVREPAASIS